MKTSDLSQSNNMLSKKRLRNEDSSDEEEINIQNQEYKFSNINFESLSKQLNADKNEVIKSVLLHNIGRMVIYSPEIDTKYRKYKNSLLPEESTIKVDDNNKFHTENLGIKVRNLEDIIVLGRLMRRSQVRDYKNISNSEDHRITALVNISSDKQKTGSIVTEKLVSNQSGLAGKDYPNTDMVNLAGESKKGDYKSAYKDNKDNHGKLNIEEFISAGKKTSKTKPSTDLDEAIDTIEKLKKDIASNYKQINSDIFIAESIRKVCRSEPLIMISADKNISDKIYALTYLLFKTEVYRSPAALVNHIQMLDLIINGEMSFEEAFVKQEMPMSMKGAIRSGRDLGNIYNEESSNLFYKYENPYQYKSSSSETSPISLIHQESLLMDKWLKLKFGEEEFQKINSDLEQYLPKIFKEIYGALQGFGLNIHSKTFNRAMEPLITKNKSIQQQEENKPKSPDTIIKPIEVSEVKNCNNLNLR